MDSFSDDSEIGSILELKIICMPILLLVLLLALLPATGCDRESPNKARIVQISKTISDLASTELTLDNYKTRQGIIKETVLKILNLVESDNETKSELNNLLSKAVGLKIDDNERTLKAFTLKANYIKGLSASDLYDAIKKLDALDHDISIFEEETIVKLTLYPNSNFSKAVAKFLADKPAEIKNSFDQLMIDLVRIEEHLLERAILEAKITESRVREKKDKLMDLTDEIISADEILTFCKERITPSEDPRSPSWKVCTRIPSKIKMDISALYETYSALLKEIARLCGGEEAINRSIAEFERSCSSLLKLRIEGKRLLEKEIESTDCLDYQNFLGTANRLDISRLEATSDALLSRLYVLHRLKYKQAMEVQSLKFRNEALTDARRLLDSVRTLEDKNKELKQSLREIRFYADEFRQGLTFMKDNGRCK